MHLMRFARLEISQHLTLAIERGALLELKSQLTAC